MPKISILIFKYKNDKLDSRFDVSVEGAFIKPNVIFEDVFNSFLEGEKK